jgi:vesicle coat complex subunit
VIKKSNQNLAGKVLELIQNLLKDDNLSVRKSASISIAEIVKADPNFAGKGLELV